MRIRIFGSFRSRDSVRSLSSHFDSNYLLFTTWEIVLNIFDSWPQCFASLQNDERDDRHSFRWFPWLWRILVSDEQQCVSLLYTKGFKECGPNCTGASKHGPPVRSGAEPSDQLLNKKCNGRKMEAHTQRKAQLQELYLANSVLSGSSTQVMDDGNHSSPPLLGETSGVVRPKLSRLLTTFGEMGIKGLGNRVSGVGQDHQLVGLDVDCPTHPCFEGRCVRSSPAMIAR